MLAPHFSGLLKEQNGFWLSAGAALPTKSPWTSPLRTPSKIWFVACATAFERNVPTARGVPMVLPRLRWHLE
jgi:hypothetical protein